MSDTVQISFDDILGVIGTVLEFFFELLWNYVIRPTFIFAGAVSVPFWIVMILLVIYAPAIGRALARIIIHIFHS